MSNQAPIQNNHKLMKLRTRMARNAIMNTICIIAIVCGIGWIGGRFWHFARYEVTNNATIEQYITPVNIRVSGYIRTVDFDEHQRVKKGDTLLTLENQEYRIKVSDAEAALADVLSNVATLESSIETQLNNTYVQKSTIEQTEIALHQLEKDNVRLAALLQQQGISHQQYEQQETELKSTQTKRDLQHRQLRSIELQIKEIENKVASAKAIVERRKSDLEMALLNLSYTVVTAPYDGYVGRRTLGQGQLVQAGQILTNIISQSNKWVTANYKETQLSNIYIGQQVNIKVDAKRGKVYRGVVKAISEATGSKYSLIPTDNSAGNFVKVQQRIPVRIEFIDLTEQQNQELRAGMMVVAEARLFD